MIIVDNYGVHIMYVSWTQGHVVGCVHTCDYLCVCDSVAATEI